MSGFAVSLDFVVVGLWGNLFGIVVCLQLGQRQPQIDVVDAPEKEETSFLWF